MSRNNLNTLQIKNNEGSDLIDEAFVENKNLKDDIELSKISDNLKIVLNKIYSNLSRDLNIEITNPDEANKYIQDERYKRFNSSFWNRCIKYKSP